MIKHIKCNIFESGADIICHQVNCQGVMGSGIAKQVREKCPEVYKDYKELCNNENKKGNLLGTAQFCWIDGSEEQMIVNLFAQERYGYDGKCYTDYDALEACLEKVALIGQGYTIAIPYLMGCCRGGGNWNVVYKMIEEIFENSDCEVLICEYNGG